MGRPLNKKYFGNTNTGGLGGESVASVTLSGTNNSSGYSVGNPVTFAAPTIEGGVTAVGEVASVTGGRIDTISITTAGTGYTAVPAATATVGTIGTLVLTSVLSATRQNAMIFASATTAATNRADGDIVAQRGSKRFKVTNEDGTAVCKLVTDGVPNAAGEMNINAEDSAGKTYYVSKISGRTCTVVPYGAAGHEFATGTKVRWTFAAAVANTTVMISNN